MHTHTPSEPVNSFAALVGIDWADQKHDVALRVAGQEAIEHRQVSQKPEALEQWMTDLYSEVRGPIAVVVEVQRGALINALLKYDFVTIFPLPPARLSQYRESFSCSGAKDDPTDAELLLDYLKKHSEHLRAWRPDDALTRKIQLLSEKRRHLVDLGTRLSNQLTANLKEYFPQALEWFNDIDSTIACDFLLRWPSLQAAQRAQAHTIRKFFYGHNSRNRDRIENIVQAIREAMPLTSDDAVMAACQITTKCVVRQLKPLKLSLAEVDHTIQQLYDEHPDAHIFRSLPGAGRVMGPRLLAAFGTDRGRYSSASEVQRYSGIAPVTRRSGKRCTIHRRWACPKFLRQTFHEFARFSLTRSTWAKAYYDLLKSKGVKHHAALRALAFKWIRVIYACWLHRTPYDEQQYIDALRRTGSPVAALLNRQESAASVS